MKKKRKPRISIYNTTSEIRNGIDNGNYYSTESELCRSTLYVMSTEEMLIVQDDYTFRIPAKLFEEIGALALDLVDNRKRRFI